MKKIVIILLISLSVAVAADEKKYNVLFVISDDLTATAIGSYGNKVCKTPNIDKLASEGIRFSRAFAQATSCGPSRASLMFGYYPQASGATGYASGRKALFVQHIQCCLLEFDSGLFASLKSAVHRDILVLSNIS